MEIISNIAQIEPYDSKIFREYFEGLAISIIDIETTGLNPSFAKVILGGLLAPEEKHIKIE